LGDCGLRTEGAGRKHSRRRKHFPHQNALPG
jgi:hypothetical protein